MKAFFALQTTKIQKNTSSSDNYGEAKRLFSTQAAMDMNENDTRPESEVIES